MSCAGCWLSVLPMLLAASLGAQLPEARNVRVVHGVVTGRGTPLAGANVFDLETLEGGFSGEDGTFAVMVRDTLRQTIRLTVRRIGYTPVELAITHLADTLHVDLEALTSLASVSVIAGRFTANAERTAALTPLEVMTTPGGGDVNAAVKTLPGVQNVDEGSGLFVRGGDYTETRTFIEGAPLFTAYQFETPTGSVAGTINPFLTDGITFSAGGFGAQWGNALSGVVDLHPQGRPQSSYVSANATMLSVGAGAALRLPHGAGVSATAGFSDLSDFLALNGNPRGYQPAPRGSTFSVQGIWEYSRTGHVTVFGLRQRSAMGVEVDDPSVSSVYRNTRLSDIAVLSLHDTLGAWRPFVALSTSGLSRSDTNGALGAANMLRSWQARMESSYRWTERVTALAGVESERTSARYDTRFPVYGYDAGALAPTFRASLDRTALRAAEYLQVDAWPLTTLEVIAGVRTDRSAYAAGRTTDPRISGAWKPLADATFTASWGEYHQVVDPAFLEQATAGPPPPAIRARMSIVGAQLGEGTEFVRVEGWRKDYRDLVALTRDFTTVPGLAGRASGIDVFARGAGPHGTRFRLTGSGGRSRRTDPNSLIDAPAPYDVSMSITGVIERDWPNGWHVGASHRFATGRPFTDVIGATYDGARQLFVPDYGPANARRLPGYERADIAVSRARMLSGNRFLVVFGALQNPFNIVNLAGYTWTRDYATRVSVRSAVNRTLFIGANLVQGRNP